MASFYYGGPPHPLNAPSPASAAHHNHHGGRSRRAPRMPGQHNPKHMHRAARQLKDAPVPEAPAAIAFRREFEAARSFDLDDDEVFCPYNLLTEDDLHSIQSSASDRSSLASGSPETSPLQPQLQPSGFSLTSASQPPHLAAPFHHHQVPQHHMTHQQAMKLHAPMAQRTRNAIPIVDPSTHRHVSPPPSVSPARQLQPQHNMPRRW